MIVWVWPAASVTLAEPIVTVRRTTLGLALALAATAVILPLFTVSVIVSDTVIVHVAGLAPVQVTGSVALSPVVLAPPALAVVAIAEEPPPPELVPVELDPPPELLLPVELDPPPDPEPLAGAR